MKLLLSGADAAAVAVASGTNGENDVHHFDITLTPFCVASSLVCPQYSNSWYWFLYLCTVGITAGVRGEVLI